MAILHVRNVPDDLYERLRRRAAAENRSLSAEVVDLLQQAMGIPETGPTELWERIARRRRRLEQQHGRFPSSVDLLREDRGR
jgi:plasmid stability protein